MTDLRKQFDYYVEHQDELVAQHDGRFIVIHGEAVVGDFDSELAAYAFAKEKFEAGSFMIQLVGPGEGNYTQTFHSRVAI
jgi:hypothetical protein